MRTKLLSLVVLAASLGSIAHAQQAACARCSASYIPESEVAAYARRGKVQNITDQQIRAVDAGNTNVAAAVVYRPRLTQPGNAAEHDLDSEGYHVISGSATLVTGWDIVDKQRRPADYRSVRELNGPGNDGSAIRNGQVHELKAGDVLFIPAGVGHQFTKIDDHIEYLMIRVDPDKVTPTKDAAASAADLRGQ